MYNRESLIKVLEEEGYVNNDIQRGNVSGDQLHFALNILIAKKLDKLLAVNEITYSEDDANVLLESSGDDSNC